MKSNVFDNLRIPILAGCTAVGAVVLFAGVPSTGNAAERHHLLPFIVDGDGIRSRLLVTNVSEASNRCSVDLVDPNLFAGRFEDHVLVTAEDAGATFELEKDGGDLILVSEGEQDLTFGYARLDCMEPVTAQALFSSSFAGEPVSLASLSSARKADRFQFTLMPQVGSLVLVFANDMDSDASCEAYLESLYGSVLSQESISVSAMTSVFRMTDELFRIPKGYTAGAVRVFCDRDVAATGFLLHGGKFSVLPPVVLSAPLIGISSGAAVTEGGDAVFTVSANAPSFVDLTLSLTISTGGSHVAAGDLGEKQVILPAGRTSVDYIVATIDDEQDEVDGTVTVTIDTAEGYIVSEINDSAKVAIRDDDQSLPFSGSPASQPPVSQPPVSQPPVTPPGQVEPPSPVLESISFFLDRERGRQALIQWDTQPEDVSVSLVGLAFSPPQTARVFSSSRSYIQIHCFDGYTGDLEITLWAREGNVELKEIVNFFCE